MQDPAQILGVLSSAGNTGRYWQGRKDASDAAQILQMSFEFMNPAQAQGLAVFTPAATGTNARAHAWLYT